MLTFTAAEAPYVALAIAEAAQLHSVRAYDWRQAGDVNEAARHSNHASVFEMLAKKTPALPFEPIDKRPAQLDLLGPG